MNRKAIVFVGTLIVSVLIIISCTGGPATSPTDQQAPTAVEVNAAKETGPREWDKLIAEAKKEGKVVIDSSTVPYIRDELSKAFTGKYGVNLEFISGKPDELIPRVLAERRAGLYVVDLFIGGLGGIDTILGPAGVLEPLDPMLLLPEVVDKKAWWKNELPWVDPNHFHIMFIAAPLRPITIHKELVGVEEIKSYRDLLNPKWKGKITYDDPTIAGGGRELFTMLAESDLGMEYLRKLGEQEIVITRDNRLIIEWVARGKYPVGIGIRRESQREFEQAGAPIKTLTPIEGTYIGGGGGGLALMKNAPHPNASKLFINWLFSKEGQTVASQVWGAQSAREDVPTGFLYPDVLREPGVKYMPALTLEHANKAERYQKIAQDFWADLMK